MNDDQIKKLDEVLEEEDLRNGYIGKTIIYKCPLCGAEKIIPAKNTEDVVCDECQEDMHPVDESIIDEQEVAAIKELGPTEPELLTDGSDDIEVEDVKGITTEDTGNLIDIGEHDDLTVVDPDAIVPEDEDDVEIEEDVPEGFSTKHTDDVHIDLDDDDELEFATDDDEEETLNFDDDDSWDTFSLD